MTELPPSEVPPSELPSSGNQVLVAVSDLTKHYGPIRAVDSITFEVRRGDVLAFLGPNGAGKTTAMKMITGFLEPDAGRVEVCGGMMTPAAIGLRRRIGYLPENAPAYGEMTVEAFLDFIADVRELPQPKKAVTAVIERTGLAEVRHQSIETLSKGYKRRVGLAQALIHDPEVLILDEPTDGLDPNQKKMIQDLIANLSSDRSIILSTHILDEAERVCNRAMILSRGKILVDSTPAELVTRAPDHNVVRIGFVDRPPDGVVGRLNDTRWCESAAMLEDGRLEIRPRDGQNCLAEVLELLGPCAISDVDVHQGRLDDLFREVTQGVAA